MRISPACPVLPPRLAISSSPDTRYVLVVISSHQPQSHRFPISLAVNLIIASASLMPLLLFLVWTNWLLIVSRRLRLLPPQAFLDGASTSLSPFLPLQALSSLLLLPTGSCFDAAPLSSAYSDAAYRSHGPCGTNSHLDSNSTITTSVMAILWSFIGQMPMVPR